MNFIKRFWWKWKNSRISHFIDSLLAWLPLLDIFSDYAFLFSIFVFSIDAEKFTKKEQDRQKLVGIVTLAVLYNSARVIVYWCIRSSKLQEILPSAYEDKYENLADLFFHLQWGGCYFTIKDWGYKPGRNASPERIEWHEMCVKSNLKNHSTMSIKRIGTRFCLPILPIIISFLLLLLLMLTRKADANVTSPVRNPTQSPTTLTTAIPSPIPSTQAGTPINDESEFKLVNAIAVLSIIGICCGSLYCFQLQVQFQQNAAGEIPFVTSDSFSSSSSVADVKEAIYLNETDSPLASFQRKAPIINPINYIKVADMDDPDYMEAFDGISLSKKQSVSENTNTLTPITKPAKRQPENSNLTVDNIRVDIHHADMEDDYVSGSPDLGPTTLSEPHNDYSNHDYQSTVTPSAPSPNYMGATGAFRIGSVDKKEVHFQEKNKKLLKEFEESRGRYVIKDRHGEKGVARDAKGIGEGRFGAVFSGTYRGAPVALKRMDNIEQFVREGSLFFECCLHLNICRFYGIYISDDDAYIVMELFKDGSILETMLSGSNKDQYTIKNKISICHQLACGLYHLHCEEVIHADLSLRNCLIDFKSFRAAITDFGLAQSMKSLRPMKYLAPRWASPELIQKRIPDEYSDVWALGITFWEIFHNGSRPFGIQTTQQVISKLVKRELTPKFSDNIPDDIKFLIQRMCNAQSPLANRWKALEVMQSLENLLDSYKGGGEGGAEMI